MGNQKHDHYVAEALEERSQRIEKKNSIIMYRVPEPETSNEEKEADDDVKMVKEILTIVHPNIDSVNLDVKNVTRMGKVTLGQSKSNSLKMIQRARCLEIQANLRPMISTTK